MGDLCCQKGLANYGRSNCTITADSILFAIAISTFDDANTFNQVNLAQPFTQTNLDLLVSNSVPARRWVRLPDLTGADTPIADTVFDEAPNGEKSFVREGIWSISGEIRDKDAHASIQKALKSLRCKDFAFAYVTRSNQLLLRIMSTDPDSAFYNIARPFLMNGSSVDAKGTMKNDTQTNKIMFMADMSPIMKQEDLYIIEGNEIGVDFLGMRKLTDVNVIQTATPLTATAIEVDLRSGFRSGLAPNNDIVGLPASAFVLTNKTTNTPVLIATVVEDLNIDGRYLLTYPTQTAGNSLELALNLANFYNGSLNYVAV